MSVKGFRKGSAAVAVRRWRESSTLRRWSPNACSEPSIPWLFGAELIVR